jgi:basic amino acid/polyamine antiporter, APA family
MNTNDNAAPQNTESAAAPASSTPTLARTMGLGALIIYGVGDMLGSGVYALIGKAAGTMGNAVWVAFLVAMLAAVFTGLSYASLGSRYPCAGGVAYISQRAFGMPFLSYVLGLAVVASGLTSFAVQSRTFAGYFQGLLEGASKAADATPLYFIIGFIVMLTLINFIGIKESTWLNAICTGVEVLGLAIVIIVGFRYWGGVNLLEVPPAKDASTQNTSALSLTLMLQGAVLTFYSFIGFEDMLNVSEEVKNPQRNFPLGVLGALAITTVIYVAIAITAVSVMPWQQLAESKQPLVDVVKTAAPAFPSWLFSLIALFAIANTGLLNFIMGSRLIYGMARQGFVPKFLGAIHPQRRTPHLAIVFLAAIVLVLAMSADVRQLASATSTLLLSVFIVVNLALFVLQRRPGEPKGRFEIPGFIPILGMIVCAAILSQVTPSTDETVPAYLRDPRLIAGALLAGIVLLYLVARPRNISEETLSEAYEAH